MSIYFCPSTLGNGQTVSPRLEFAHIHLDWIRPVLILLTDNECERGENNIGPNMPGYNRDTNNGI